MATAVPGVPCMVIRVHPDVVIGNWYTFVSAIGSVTLTGLIVAVPSTGGISCALKHSGGRRQRRGIDPAGVAATGLRPPGLCLKSVVGLRRR